MIPANGITWMILDQFHDETTVAECDGCAVIIEGAKHGATCEDCSGVPEVVREGARQLAISILRIDRQEFADHYARKGWRDER